MGNIFNDYARARGNRIGKAVEAELGKRQGQRTDLASEGQGSLLGELRKNFCEVNKRTDQVAAEKAGDTFQIGSALPI